MRDGSAGRCGMVPVLRDSTSPQAAGRSCGMVSHPIGDTTPPHRARPAQTTARNLTIPHDDAPAAEVDRILHRAACAVDPRHADDPAEVTLRGELP